MASRQVRQAASFSLRELLDGCAWYPLLDMTARREVLQAASERAIASGGAVSHQGDIPICWYGVLEGQLKWSITGRDGTSLTLGAQSPGSWFGVPRCAPNGR